MNDQNQNNRNNKWGEHHKNCNQNRPRGVFSIAFILIAVGLVLLLNSLNIIPNSVEHVLISWPMLLVVIGIGGFFKDHNNMGNWIVLSVGAFFLIPRIWDIPDYTGTFWPLILILIGILLLTRSGELRRRVREASVTANKGTDEYIDDVNIFGGGQRIYTSQNFRGGKVTSIFGGSEIDLTKAKLAPGTNIIEVAYVFGGSTIIVPSSWTLRIETTAIFGSITDKRMITPNPDAENDAILVIKGSAIFGGGEIKSY